MGTPKGSLACRCRSLLNAVLSNAVLQKQCAADRSRRSTALRSAVPGSLRESLRPSHFMRKESPLTREDAGPIGTSDRFPCDTAEADVADVHSCGIREARAASHPMGQTAQPAVVAGIVDPGGATSGTDHAIAAEISLATFCHSAGVPALGRRADARVLADVHEGRQVLESECLDQRAVRVEEDHGPVSSSSPRMRSAIGAVLGTT